MKLQKEYHLSVLPWTGCTSSKKIWMVRLLQCLFEYNESPRSTALSSGLHHSTEHHIPPYILWLGEPCNSASRTRHGWVKRGIVNYARATVANWWTNRNTGSLDLHQLHSWASKDSTGLREGMLRVFLSDKLDVLWGRRPKKNTVQ